MYPGRNFPPRRQNRRENVNESIRAREVRAVLWQYWFTNIATKRATGMWWRREYLGLYAPSLELEADGKFLVTGFPGSYPPP